MKKLKAKNILNFINYLEYTAYDFGGSGLWLENNDEKLMGTTSFRVRFLRNNIPFCSIFGFLFTFTSPAFSARCISLSNSALNQLPPMSWTECHRCSEIVNIAALNQASSMPLTRYHRPGVTIIDVLNQYWRSGTIDTLNQVSLLSRTRCLSRE